MWEIFFLKSLEENDPGTLVPDIFLFSKTALYEIQASGQHSSLNMFWQSFTWACNKKKWY